MTFKNWDWKWISLALSFCAAAYLAYRFQWYIFQAFRSFFEFPQLNLCAGGLSVILTTVHKIKMRKLSFTTGMSFSEFRIPVQGVLSFISNPITLVGSLSLAKGLFLQFYEHQQFFPFFDTGELGFVAVVTAYLLFISFMELKKYFRESFTRAEGKMAVPEAITKQQFENHT